VVLSLMVAATARAQEAVMVRAAASATVISAPTSVPVRAPVGAATTSEGAFIVHDYGDSAPLVTCQVLRACVIELQAGEVLVDEPIAGDQARWIVTRGRAGIGGASTLVIVKPKACDLATNLVLSTDRRIYAIDLASSSCRASAAGEREPWVRHLRFRYADTSAATRGATHAPETISAAESRASRDGSITASPRDSSAPPLNRAYRILGRRRGPFGLFGHRAPDFPWRPNSIADDGAHVYVTLPAIASRHAAPVLYALEEDGSRTMVNFVLRDRTLVTDRVFRRGQFVVMAGDREQRLEFENRHWSLAPEERGRDR
jgi:type IV secretion system protein VirB9